MKSWNTRTNNENQWSMAVATQSKCHSKQVIPYSVHHMYIIIEKQIPVVFNKQKKILLHVLNQEGIDHSDISLINMYIHVYGYIQVHSHLGIMILLLWQFWVKITGKSILQNIGKYKSHSCPTKGFSQ